MNLFGRLLSLAAAASLALGIAATPSLASQATIIMPLVGPHSMADLDQNWFNPAFQSLLTTNSGPIAPTNGPGSVPLLGEWWMNTASTPYPIGVYDGAQWAPFGSLNPSTHALSWIGAPISPTYGGLNNAPNNAIPYGQTGAIPAFVSPVNNAVLATNGSGVPAEVTTLPSGLSLPSPTLSSTLPGNINVGPTTPVISTSMAFDWGTGPSADQTFASQEAGIWPGTKIYTEMNFARTFTSANNSSSSGLGPNMTVFMFARNTGDNNDVAPFVADANCTASNTTCFGGNVVARSNGGSLTNVKLDGFEIDWEPATGDGVSSNSGALFINSFNAQAPVGIQLGGLGGGTYLNGIIFSANVSGTGLGPQSGVTMGSLINASQGSYTNGAILLGTGASQSLNLGTGGFGVSPIFYGASNGDTDLNLGSSNFFNILSSSGATKFAFNASAGNFYMPKVTASGLAPGAGSLKLEVVAGTNAGTCKLIAYAGTSTTATTISDNIGGGC